jgi:hypothetical protein
MIPAMVSPYKMHSMHIDVSIMMKAYIGTQVHPTASMHGVKMLCQSGLHMVSETSPVK